MVVRGPSSGAEEVGDVGREQQLAKIRLQLETLEKQLSSIEQRQQDVVASYARTRAELRVQEARVAEAELAASLAEEQLDEATQHLLELEAEMAERKAVLQRRLTSIQGFGRRGYLELFLSLDAGVDVLPALRQLRFLIRRDDQAIRLYRESRDALAATRDELAQRRQEAERWHELQTSRRDELAVTRRRQSRLLARLKERRDSMREQSASLRTKSERLERLGAALLAEGVDSLSGVPIQELQGALDWPIAGEVTVPFGSRRDPRYGTVVPHNGIELRVEEGNAVRAVYPGEVRFAAQFQDLGYTVVVQHPGRALTLYAGLSDLLVDEGDVVGFHSELGHATAVLYFEIRVGTTPEDPRSWLR